jgi:DNA-binding MarR family transcriptional regulator
MRDIDSIRAWVYISKTYQLIYADNQREFRGYGLTTPQFDIIVNLGFRGPLNQNSLANYLLVTKGNISTVLKTLENKGLIRRDAPSDDRRLRIVRLTREGERLYKKTVRLHEEKLSSLLTRLSLRERRSLVTILKKLYYDLKA